MRSDGPDDDGGNEPGSVISEACAAFAEDLSALLDHELDPAREAELRIHLAGCARCGAELAALARADSALRASAAQERSELPAGVAERFAARLAAERAGTRAAPDTRSRRHAGAPPPRRSRRALWLGAALAAAAALGLALLVVRRSGPLPAPRAPEVARTPPAEEAPAQAPPPTAPDRAPSPAPEIARTPPEAPRRTPPRPAAPIPEDAPAGDALDAVSDEELEIAEHLDTIEDLDVIEALDLLEPDAGARGLFVGNVGGSMDLCAGAKKLIIAMEHTTKDGEYKIVNELSYPATAEGKVSMLITDLAVIEITPKGMVLKEVMSGLTAADVQSVTEPKLIIAKDLKEMQL